MRLNLSEFYRGINIKIGYNKLEDLHIIKPNDWSCNSINENSVKILLALKLFQNCKNSHITFYYDKFKNSYLTVSTKILRGTFYWKKTWQYFIKRKFSSSKEIPGISWFIPKVVAINWEFCKVLWVCGHKSKYGIFYGSLIILITDNDNMSLQNEDVVNAWKSDSSQESRSKSCL